MEVIGKELSAHEIAERVIRDKALYEGLDGGVTIISAIEYASFEPVFNS